MILHNDCVLVDVLHDMRNRNFPNNAANPCMVSVLPQPVSATIAQPCNHESKISLSLSLYEMETD